MVKIYHVFLVLFAGIVLAACSEYSKALKSDDFEKKYELAMKYFDEEDYYKSSTLIDQLIPVYTGTEKAEKLHFNLAYCEYFGNDLLMAAYRFKNFAKSYPASSHAEECIFMAAYCQYLESPAYSLDQTSTHEAIESFQLYLTRYPQTERRDSVNTIMDLLRGKLERKSYEQAYQFYKMEDYKSASIAMKNVLRDHPNSSYNESIYLHVFKSDYYLAMNSVEEKKAQRIEAAIESYQKFVDLYPQSRHLKEITSLFENLGKEKERLN